MLKFKLSVINQCDLCCMISTTKYALFCHFAKHFFHIIALFLGDFYNINEFISLKDLFILYLLWIIFNERFTQLSLLTVAGKDRCLKISKDDLNT